MRTSGLMFSSAVLFAVLWIAASVSANDAKMTLSPQALEATKPAPVEMISPAALQASIDRGVMFLLSIQAEKGYWGSARNTKGLNIYAPVPGAHHAFRAACTSLCISALIECGPTGNNEIDAKVATALDKAEAWLLANLPNVRRATPDAIYNVWTHAYSIQALVRMHRRHEGNAAKQAEIIRHIEEQIALLKRYESVDGGWGYYDFRIGTQVPASSSTSFVNATGLVALYEAKQLGVNVPERMVERAIAATQRQRKPDCSYIYGEYLKMRPFHPVNRPGGSLGRSQACNVALYLWKQPPINEQVMSAWLDRLFTRGGWLDIGRKRPVPHEAWFAIAGYFYYYGYYYAALEIEALPKNERPFYQAHMANVITTRQEKDGSWWDYPFYDYHQQYGTAFALMSLVRCRAAPP